MGYKEFFPFGTKSIEINFKCDSCNNEVITEELFIPSPNYAAEKASDSHNESEESAYCVNCDKDFEISINVGYADAYVDIDVPDENILQITENPEDEEDYYNDQVDSILSSSNYYALFLNEIENLKSLNDVDLKNSIIQKTLLRQIYSSTISCLEDYLSSTLIKEVLNNEENFRNFVKTNPKIKNQKFNLNDIYEELEKITDVVKRELVAVIYHDLPKVKNMYQDSLKIAFPEISELMLIIKTRHDMVHRNGKDKDGKIIEITESTIDEIIETVEEFVLDIESKIKNEDIMKKFGIK